ncbi:MAG: anti-sigma F factor [Acutalibacteraceae bacterium]|nr:anti-sigma F factor [Acutalibacteraceae bacterium]
MNIINEMKLLFDSRSANEAFARSSVAGFVVQLDPTIAELSDIKTAVSEAVTNAIVHGYSNTIGTVTIKVQITDTNIVIIQVKDKGVGIENIQQAMEPMFTTGGSERAGLGFAVMQSFMDKIKVVSKPGKGTTVTMEKYIMPKISVKS